MFREGLTVKEAAKQLGVSQQRVRAMVGRHQLPADSDTRILLIDPVAVERRAQTQHVPHRSLQASNAWALLALASGDPGLASSLAAVNYSMRSRLRARLRGTRVIDLAPLLRKRADLVWLRA